MKHIKIKICGLSDEPNLSAAIDAGVDFVGFVHFEKSQRHVTIERLQALAGIAKTQNKEVQTVAVVVNPEDALLQTLANIRALDYVQLHGQETPERVQHIKKISGKKIIKAIAVSNTADVAAAADYQNIADMLCFDAKPPKGVENAGGFGVSFDWNLLASPPTGEWMLSGGLDSENVAQAVHITRAPIVDVSSHVETPIGSGKKDAQKIREFIKKVRAIV